LSEGGMRKVLYISYDGALDPLGKSQIIPYLASLSRSGNKITLLTFEKRINFSDQKKLNRQMAEFNNCGINWRYLRYHKRPAVPATLYDIFHAILVAGKIVQKDRVGLIHARSYISGIVAVTLKKIFGIKFIFDIRGLWPDEKVDAGAWKKDGLVYRVMKFFEKRMFSCADWIVVLSQRGKDLIKEKFSLIGNISVIPTCTDLDLFVTRGKNVFSSNGDNDKKETVFLYLGSLGSWYMFDAMLDFFCECRNNFENPAFLFLSNNNGEEVMRQIQKSNLPASECIVKSADYRDLCVEINKAHVSVFFIRPVYSKIASCPTKLGESLACGLPVIINSGIGDTDRLVEKEGVGVVIDDFSSGSYAKAITALKGLLAEGPELSRRCRLAAEKFFSLDIGVNEYSRIYGILRSRQ